MVRPEVAQAAVAAACAQATLPGADDPGRVCDERRRPAGSWSHRRRTTLPMIPDREARDDALPPPAGLADQGLAPTVPATAEHDPLRDEGDALALQPALSRFRSPPLRVGRRAPWRAVPVTGEPASAGDGTAKESNLPAQ